MGLTARRVVAVAAAVALTAPVLAACNSSDPKATATGDCVAAASVPTMKIALSTIHVNVLNAGGGNGEAASVASQLSWRGIHIISTGNDPTGGAAPKYAEIRYGPNGKQIALTVAQQVEHAKLVEDDRTDPSVDVVIGTHFALVPVPPPPAKKVTITVLNAFVIRGTASDVASMMRKQGFHVTKIGNTKDFYPDHAVIIRYGLKGLPAAQRVALQFHDIRMVQDKRKSGTVDVVIGSKWTDDAIVPAAQATPKPTPTPSKPSCAPVTK